MLESLDLATIQKSLDEKKPGFKLLAAHTPKDSRSTYLIVDFNDGTFSFPLCAKIRVSDHPNTHDQGKYFFVSLRSDLPLVDNENELVKLVNHIKREIGNIKVKYRNRLTQRF